jgi:5'-nucleotidase
VSRRPRILLTNDDGVRADGLRAAYVELAKIADVTVVAPTTQRSGMSHTVTLEQPLRAYPLSDLPGWMVEYTPVDCVKLALKRLLPERPDLVVSGINRGTNAGQLIHYSGTVGAAVEAALNDVPAIAVSLCGWKALDFGYSAKVARVVARSVVDRPLPPHTVLNVNVPNLPEAEVKGFKVCRQSLKMFPDEYEHRVDPRGQDYYWLTGVGPFVGAAEDDDLTAVNDGWVAVTPLSTDWTALRALDDVKGAIDGLEAR